MLVLQLFLCQIYHLSKKAKVKKKQKLIKVMKF
jgi:hypothetical protein